MNNNNVQETKQYNKQTSVSNKDLNDASNDDVTRMYNMPEMTSGPSDATEKERKDNDARSASSKINTKK